MKRSISIVLSAVIALVTIVSCGENASRKAAEAEQAQAQADSIAAAQALADSIATAQKALQTEVRLANLAEEPVFNIVTSYGEIKVKLYSGTPKHRENFARLAFDGFYDGILFHRVINGFMIQAGDPLSKDESQKAKWGTGGPGYTIPAEFVPEYVHKKGALAAARMGDRANPYRESSGSQFYIVQDPAACAQLDGQYTVFGETLSGFEVIDRIAAAETDQRDCPLQPIRIISVRLMED